jgi:hypothetical protein
MDNRDMNTTLAIARLVRVICVAVMLFMGVTGYQSAMEHRASVIVSDEMASKAQKEANVARVRAEVRAYMKDHYRCTEQPRLSDSVVVIGAKYDGDYIYDQMYVLTFDEAFKAAKAGTVWVMGYCW